MSTIANIPQTKSLGNEFMVQDADGKQVKMIWADSKRYPFLASIEPQYIRLQDFMCCKTAHTNQTTLQEVREAATKYREANNTKAPLKACAVIMTSGENSISIHEASAEELKRDERDMDFWLQVYGLDPASFSSTNAKLAAVTRHEQKALIGHRLKYNGFSAGIKGPSPFDRILYNIAAEPTESGTPLSATAELMPGVIKMRGVIEKLAA